MEFAARSEEEAVRLLHEHGVCWIEGVLAPDAVETCRTAALDRFAEVLRTLVLLQAMRTHSDSPPPAIRYGEVVERDGGRYDVRHKMCDEPFATLFARDGAASRLVPLLLRALGGEADVIALGQVVAMSLEGWAQAGELADSEDVVVSLGDQEWHTDGPVSLFAEATTSSHLPPYALNVFFPLVDLNGSNGPTEFAAGPGSAIIFDYRLWHRGRANNSDQDRPMLYAVVARPWFHDYKNHRYEHSLFGGQVAPCPRMALGEERAGLPVSHSDQLADLKRSIEPRERSQKPSRVSRSKRSASRT
ncbi:hypothetical protein AB1Y20_015222 [Prymnesium parvum]|uniref:Phytanoyl-CoA dioxygenase family protein n=1 Tax=Prymnesium parvum TaxID=97485 RepID=A0AB34JZX9_PRYPA